MNRTPTPHPLRPLGVSFGGMFCQACGAKNVEDARFCNMCGTPIAAPGAPGGPIVPAEAEESAPTSEPEASGPRVVPKPGGTMVLGSQRSNPPPPLAASPGSPEENVWAAHDGSRGHPQPRGYVPAGDNVSIANVSLASIGVRTPGKAWGVVIGVAALLIALGAGAMWAFVGGTGSSAEQSAAGPSDEELAAAADNDVWIGTPLPEGVEPPDIDFIAGGASPESRPSAARSSAGPRPRPSRTERRSAPQPSPGASPTRPSANRPAPTTMASETGRSPSAMTTPPAPDPGAAAMTEPAPTMRELGAEAPTPGNAEVPAERDIAMELYTGRVRYVISRYYAARAQSCFEHATRNAPELHGTVLVGFTIGAEGQVTGARATRNTTGNDSLGRCLANQVRTWRMPAPEPGMAPLSLEIPFSR